MKKIIILPLLVYFIYGCSSAKITYKKMDDYNVPLEKVFIVQVLPEYQDLFKYTFKTEFSKYLDGANVEHHIYDYNVDQEALSLGENRSEKELKSIIDAYKPFHVMVIQFKSKQSVGGAWGTSSSTSKFNITLTDIIKGEKVWVAEVETEKGTYSTQRGEAEKMAVELIKSLIKSGFIQNNININE